MKKGLSDRVRRVKGAANKSAVGKHASLYAERNKKIASEFVNPSQPLDLALTHLLGGRGALASRAAYAYRQGQNYMMTNHSIQDAFRMRATDAAIVSTAALGVAAVNAWQRNHPIYED